jgi:hypothetical protein
MVYTYIKAKKAYHFVINKSGGAQSVDFTY